MREIKFRAWDFTEEKMIQWDELTEGKHSYNYLSMLRSTLGMVIFMQYTGLKDKNGKEIYEGDIVKHPEFNIVSKVYWDEKDVCFSSNSLPSEWQYEEVIGNIYQHPELLK